MDIKLTKIIDQYIQGEMSEADKKAFEERLESNATLKAEYELQLAIAEVAKRNYLQQNIQQRAQRYHLLKTLKIVAIIAAISTIAASTIYFSFATSTPATSEIEIQTIEKQQPSTPQATFTTHVFNLETQEVEEQINIPQNSDPYRNSLINRLPEQRFEVPQGGGILFSNAGVIISVPKGAFLKNGNVYEGETQITFQEAISPAEIMLAGLSTVNNNNLLETQGMFSFSAKTATGDSLTINPDVGIYFEVPVDELKEGMQLYDGEKDAQGEVNWVNPVPLKKIPVLADMADLDFYPEKFEPTLDSLKWFTSNQKRDSLYLSMEGYFWSGSPSNPVDETIPTIKIDRDPPIINKRGKLKEIKWKNNTEGDTAVTMIERTAVDTTVTVADFIASDFPEYISPSKVLALWNKKYNNTNLSTLAFQRRMQAIHNTCDNRVLDLYVNGLDRDLVDIDKQVVGLGYAPFNEFVKENIGKIDMDDAHVQSLSNLYLMVAQILKNEAQQNAHLENLKNSRKEEDFQRSKQQNVIANNSIKNNGLAEETALNLKKFGFEGTRRGVNNTLNNNGLNNNKTLNIKKFGFERTSRGVSRRPSVGVRVNKGSKIIKNIDRLTREATANRTNLSAKNIKTGKLTTLTYEPAFLQVQSKIKMDHQYAYFLPKQLSSYHKQMLMNDTVSYKLNMDFQYDLLVVGIKNDDFYVEYRSAIAPQNYSIPLTTAYTRAAADSLINSVCSSAKNMQSDLKNELKFFEERRAYQVHKTKQREMEQFRRHIAKQIFPCYVEDNRMY